jgi:hypothetical protein
MSNLYHDRSSTNLVNSNVADPEVDGTVRRILTREEHNRRNVLLNRLFPDQLHRSVVAGELAMVETDFAFRLKILEKSRETRFLAFQDCCNYFLQQGKAAIELESRTFVLGKSRELSLRLQEITEEFEETLDKKYKELDLITNEKIKETRRNRIDAELDRFNSLCVKLINDFDQVINIGS